MNARVESAQRYPEADAAARARQSVAAGLARINELNAGLRDYTAPMLFGFAVLIALVIGKTSSLERYITPERGMGYTLGIVGGVMMLTLLLYPVRKRYRSLAWMGPVKYWFRVHMVFGILGPALILFHCNFSLGATNSNVALFAMLVVAGSGIVGRYLYARIHRGLYGAHVELKELKQDAELAQRGLTGMFDSVPGLRERLTEFEALATRVSLNPGHAAVHMIVMPLQTHWTYREAMRSIRSHLRSCGIDRRRRQHVEHNAASFLRVYLDAVRKVSETAFYERLFSHWHVLHLPLFFMLIVTAIIHVIAVHVY
jgi:hypothetical protein